MVGIILHKNFVKKYKRLSQAERKRFSERRDIFMINPFETVLNNHPLKGKYKGYRSIDITTDLRVIFEMVEENVAYFITIDSHSNLYS